MVNIDLNERGCGCKKKKTQVLTNNGSDDSTNTDSK